MLKVFTFWSAKNNDVLFAIAYSQEEAINILLPLIEDTSSYIIGTSINCVIGAYGSTSILKDESID